MQENGDWVTKEDSESRISKEVRRAERRMMKIFVIMLSTVTLLLILISHSRCGAEDSVDGRPTKKLYYWVIEIGPYQSYETWEANK